MSDETESDGPLTAVLHALVLQEGPDRDFDIGPEDDEPSYTRYRGGYGRPGRYGLPYVVKDHVRGAGKTGQLMWQDFRSFRLSLQNFRADGIDEFPCWSFPDNTLAPVDLDNKVIISHLNQGRPFLRRAFPGVRRRDAASQAAAWRTFSTSSRMSLRTRAQRKRPSDELVEDKPSFTSTENAASIFTRLFSQSLSYAASTSSSVQNLVEVHNVWPGYRIHWTYQYWMSPTVFGSPSTPVTGQLAAGSYRFGGDKPRGQLVWDKGIHNLSPSTTRVDLVDF